jgi:hypothetical protein
MKFDDKGNAVFESTGAKTWVSCGIISVDDNLNLDTGCDCSFRMDIPDTNGEDRELTPTERVELADHYIKLWTRFRNEPQS